MAIKIIQGHTNGEQPEEQEWEQRKERMAQMEAILMSVRTVGRSCLPVLPVRGFVCKQNITADALLLSARKPRSYGAEKLCM